MTNEESIRHNAVIECCRLLGVDTNTSIARMTFEAFDGDNLRVEVEYMPSGDRNLFRALLGQREVIARETQPGAGLAQPAPVYINADPVREE